MPRQPEQLGLVYLCARRHRTGDDEIRGVLSEGAHQLFFARRPSPAMEANLRFVGPETMESKIFSRLTAVWAELDLSAPQRGSGDAGALQALRHW